MRLIILALVSITTLISCNQTSKKPSNLGQQFIETDVPNTELVSLKRLINNSDGVISAKWELIRIGTGEFGPSDIVFIAELIVTEEFEQTLNKQKEINDHIGLQDTLLRKWVSVDVKNFFRPDKKNHTIKVPNLIVREPTIFVKNTLRHGFFIVKNSNVFLYLIST